MFGRLLLTAAALAAGVSGAGATKSGGAAPNDAAIAQRLSHEVAMYSKYTIWDGIGFDVSHGSVVVWGSVTEPYKRSAIEGIVRNVPGVTAVTDRIEVLPFSPQDDMLRVQVARAIYRDPMLSRYAVVHPAPIHIIVDNGHVTLAGVVNSALEKTLAGMRASSAGLGLGPVVNNLVVENPPARKG
jgi:osmotically-inducible protein OsmY